MSAIDSLIEEEGLLYRMILQTKDFPGNEADVVSKNAFTEAKLHGILAEKTSSMLETLVFCA